MLRRLVFSVLALATAACGSSPSGSPAQTSDDGGGGGADDAGIDAYAGPGCGDPQATPDMNCGTLSWATSSVKSRPRNHHVTFLVQTQAGPFLYAIGGYNKSVLNNVDRVPVQPDGSLGTWVADTALPVFTGGLTGGVVSNVIVIAGGTGFGGVLDTSYSAVVKDDGTLAAWKPGGSVLHPRMHPGAFVNASTIYVLGGFQDPQVWDDAVRATVAPDGTLSAWTSAGKLPGPRSHFSVSLVNGYVYLAGGLAQSALQSPPLLADVSRARLADDGTLVEWTAMPSLPVPLATHASFFYGGYLYLGGGINDTQEEKRFWRAPIGADHSLGAWQLAAPLPLARGHVHQLPVLGNHVYSVSGAIDVSLNSTDQIHVGVFL